MNQNENQGNSQADNGNTPPATTPPQQQPPKQKKPRSQKQIEALKRMNEKNRELRAAKKGNAIKPNVHVQQAEPKSHTEPASKPKSEPKSKKRIGIRIGKIRLI